MLFGDFYILDVKYDPSTGLAKDVRISGTDGARPTCPFWTIREKVIELIEDGYYVEMLPSDCDAVSKRVIVKVVNINGTKYLRMDGKRAAADMLAGIAGGK